MLKLSLIVCLSAQTTVTMIYVDDGGDGKLILLDNINIWTRVLFATNHCRHTSKPKSVHPEDLGTRVIFRIEMKISKK